MPAFAAPGGSRQVQERCNISFSSRSWYCARGGLACRRCAPATRLSLCVRLKNWTVWCSSEGGAFQSQCVSLRPRADQICKLKSLLQISHRKWCCASPSLASRKSSDHFIGYPATGTLEIVSTDRHEAAKALQRVVRSMKPSFYLDLCDLDCRELTLKIRKIVLRVHSQFRGYFDKLIGVRHQPYSNRRSYTQQRRWEPLSRRCRWLRPFTSV